MNDNDQAGGYFKLQEVAQSHRDEQQRQFQQSQDYQQQIYQQWRERSERTQQMNAQQQANDAASSRRMQEEWERTRPKSTYPTSGHPDDRSPSSKPTPSYYSGDGNSESEIGLFGAVGWGAAILVYVGFIIFWPFLFELAATIFR